jgi:hypothetical protein
MKTLLFRPALVAGAISLLASTAFAEEARRYKMPSAIVKYQLSGTRTGSEELAFDRFGMREVRRTTAQMTVAGRSFPSNQLTIMDGETTTTVDLTARTASQMPTPLLKELIAAARQQGGDMTDLGMKMIQRMGGVKTGDATVVGKPCEVWEIRTPATKLWVWGGVVLRSETQMAGQVIKVEALSVQENPTLPAGTFALPEGISVRSEDPMKMLREMRERMKGGTPPKKP